MAEQVKRPKYFIDSEQRFINFFAPITVKEIMTELHFLGKSFAEFEVRTVFGESREIRSIGPANRRT